MSSIENVKDRLYRLLENPGKDEFFLYVSSKDLWIVLDELNRFEEIMIDINAFTTKALEYPDEESKED